MADPATSADSKAPLLNTEQSGEQPVDCPPSYSETSTSRVVGDGNVFSDLPRPGAMTYGPGQRQAYTPRSGAWSFGFFSCFRDPGAATKALCCSCVSYGQTRHRLRSPNTKVPVFSAPCIGYLCAISLLPGSQGIFGLLQRNELRQRLEINQPPKRVLLPGREEARENVTMFEGLHSAAGFFDDAARHFLCQCCALTQEDREVRAWESQLAEEEGGLDRMAEDDEEGGRLLGSERRDGGD